MRIIESIVGRFPEVCCCCLSPEEDFEPEEERKTMKLAPTFHFWRKNATVAPGAGKASPGAASPSRMPTTRFSTAITSPSHAISRSSLAITDPAVLSSERKDLSLAVGVKVIPHPDKVAKGGEDAFFISSYDGGVLGVADGVSGWAEENVDPALFSKELMAHAEAAVGTEEVRNDPRLILAKAHSATHSIGAATAIVAILEKRGVLHVANLGDCGLRIVRNGKVVYATAPQQHYFDCPYQLSSDNAQTAADASVYELLVLEGDTIVMGSDGLFDNVYDSEIESTIQFVGGVNEEDFARHVAFALAELACQHAQDRNFDSPYAKEAVLQGHDYPWWAKIFGKKIGGKIDDITVVVGHIVSAPTLIEDQGVIGTLADTVEKEEVLADAVETEKAPDQEEEGQIPSLGSEE